jgi:hypothetical protein
MPGPGPLSLKPSGWTSKKLLPNEKLNVKRSKLRRTALPKRRLGQ